VAFTDRPGSDADFVGALAALGHPEAELRAWLLGGFGVHIPKRPATPLDTKGVPVPTHDDRGHMHFPHQSDAYWLYFNLVQTKGEARAADIVCELILTKGGARVLEVVKSEADGDDVYVSASDPEIVHLMYEEPGWPNELGEYLSDYWERSRPPDDGARLEIDDEDEDSLDEELEDEEEDDVSLKDLLRALGQEPNRKSAEPHAGLAFIRVQSPASQFVTVDPDFNEAQLEAFILEHWENMDWGFASPLYLVGSQVQLDAESRDRVDILAKGGSGQLVAIELKIGEAKPRDVSQLQAYMTHLDRRGEGKSHGLLVAADFPLRVKNAALQNRRMRLLKFRVPSS
jgi:Endonuclease NucS C-terminal domain